MSVDRVSVTREAVEAGAQVLWSASHDMPWTAAADGFKGPYLRDARAVLEAAAPHLTAFPMGMTQDEWEAYLRSYR